MQRLHPIQVDYSYHIGSRIDAEWEFPPSLEDEDLEDVLDLLSSPPSFIERLSPVSFHVGTEAITGKNPSEAMAKYLRSFQRMLQMVAGVVRQVSQDKFRERGTVAFLGLGLCPEMIRRLIEFDYENADNVYSRLVDLMRRGEVCPVATVPFHALLPLQGEFELRLLIRMGLTFYWPLLTYYNRAVQKILREDIFTMVFWLPEGAFSNKVLEVLHTEFMKKCQESNVAKSHLVLLLETGQAREREHDILMKRWHAIRPTSMTRDHVSMIFRERAFTQWVVEGHPSVKKMLDRTIAKVDAALRDSGIDYLWSHFESLESLLATPKTAVNFQQKVIKLTELGYQPMSPDAFVRRKLLDVYAREEQEPRRCVPMDFTAWSGWEDDPNSLIRWEGVQMDEERQPVKVDRDRFYMRRDGRDDPVRERGPQCWKPALWTALRACHKAVVGDSRTFLGGMLELLREIVPIERIPVQRRNVEEFLVRCSLIFWREHFTQTVYSEADIQLYEIARETLARDCPEDADIEEEQACVAGMAARAIFLAMEAQRSCGFSVEHLDQRGVYESVAMMTLGFVHAIQAYYWAGKNERAQDIFQVLSQELFDFASAFERQNLAALGVTKKDWDEALKSQVQESDLNVVARASRRVAARHLKRLGFRKQFQDGDSHITTSIGHLWSMEINQPNLHWENEIFCGLAEE